MVPATAATRGEIAHTIPRDAVKRSEKLLLPSERKRTTRKLVDSYWDESFKRNIREEDAYVSKLMRPPDDMHLQRNATKPIHFMYKR